MPASGPCSMRRSRRRERSGEPCGRKRLAASRDRAGRRLRREAGQGLRARLGGLVLLVTVAFAAAGATARYPVVSVPTGSEWRRGGTGRQRERASTRRRARGHGAGGLPRPHHGLRWAGQRGGGGRGSPAAGLEFVIITDHNVSGHRSRRGRVDGVLVIFGVEVSTSDGHLVVLGASEPLVPSRRRTGRQAVDWATGQGAFATLAHPVQRKNPWSDPQAGAGGPGLRALLGGHALSRCARLARLPAASRGDGLAGRAGARRARSGRRPAGAARRSSSRSPGSRSHSVPTMRTAFRRTPTSSAPWPPPFHVRS